MRRVAAALIGSLLLASLLQPASALAQATKKPATQPKAAVKAKAAPKAEWRAPTSPAADGLAAPVAEASSQTPPATTMPAAEAGAPEGLRAAQAINSEPAPAAKILDESEELLAIDRAFAENLVTNGPLKAYSALMSSEGILHDASGSSPAGAAGAQARFGTFPAEVTLDRSPESAMAAGGSGSSWGRYVIRRGDNQLSLGRYVTVWRREAGGWLIVTELAAGRAGPQAAAAAGPLPRRPPSAAPRPPASTPPN
ncbi:MAG: hypothetical protein CFE32_16665 [Alphaproteobacteria bacterium PA3]|nr:MAG: hypothetical protein CFE32_16665 [Alphaproteobacteria bacterium PA3]